MIRSFVIFLIVFFSGCAAYPPGLIYSNVTGPLSHDFQGTPVGSKKCIIEENGISDPVGGSTISLAWSSEHIKSVAEAAGITTITNIDEEYFSLFMGLYHRRRLIIYGE